MNVSDFMGFDPTSLSVFQEKGPKVDSNIYRTNPKQSVSEDGVYRSRVKVLMNPNDPVNSIVNQTNYWLSSPAGQRLVRSSLSIGDTSCPIFKAWKSFWYPEDEERRKFAKENFDRSESRWVIVQILEDENQPNLVGQFRVMKLAKDICEKLMARMKPSSASKTQPYPVMDYVIGLELNLEVNPGPDDPKAPERKQREISYSLSQFGDFAPIIKTDGTNLFTDEELELIDTFVTSVKDSQTHKVAKKKEEAAKKVQELKPSLKPLYEKAINYVKDNCKFEDGTSIDLCSYCGYSPWDEETKSFVDGWITYINNKFNGSPAPQATPQAAPPSPVAPEAESNDEVEVPF